MVNLLAVFIFLNRFCSGRYIKWVNSQAFYVLYFIPQSSPINDND